MVSKGGGFQKAHEKKYQMMQRRVEKLGGMSTGSGVGKYLILPKPTWKKRAASTDRAQARPVGGSILHLCLQEFWTEFKESKGDFMSNSWRGINLIFTVQRRRLIMNKSALIFFSIENYPQFNSNRFSRKQECLEMNKMEAARNINLPPTLQWGCHCHDQCVFFYILVSYYHFSVT